MQLISINDVRRLRYHRYQSSTEYLEKRKEYHLYSPISVEDPLCLHLAIRRSNNTALHKSLRFAAAHFAPRDKVSEDTNQTMGTRGRKYAIGRAQNQNFYFRNGQVAYRKILISDLRPLWCSPALFDAPSHSHSKLCLCSALLPWLKRRTSRLHGGFFLCSILSGLDLIHLWYDL